MNNSLSPRDERFIELVEALRPFAEAAIELDRDTAPDMQAEDDMFIEDALWHHEQPTVGDLRRARTAYQKATGNKQRGEANPLAAEADPRSCNADTSVEPSGRKIG